MSIKHLFIVTACVLISSCGQQEQVRQYRVAKEEKSGSGGFDAVAPSASGDSLGGQVWFLKLTSKTELFNQFRNSFARMIIDAKFSDSGPEYSLPEDWTASSGPAPLYETIKVAESEEDAVLTVMPLPAPTSDPEDYLKINIDRWRRQMGLPPLPADGWLDAAQQTGQVISIPKEDGQFLTLVHLGDGTTEKHGPTEMLVAIVSDQSLTGNAAMAERPTGSPPPAAPRNSPLAYDLPEGWRESSGSSMRLVSLAADHESGAADISVIQLPGGGDVLPNINRWREQVKLEKISAEELKQTLEDVEVAGMSGQLSLIKGTEQSILAAIVEQDGTKWFYKMMGPTPAVEAEQENFRKFLKSVQLKENPE